MQNGSLVVGTYCCVESVDVVVFLFATECDLCQIVNFGRTKTKAHEIVEEEVMKFVRTH